MIEAIIFAVVLSVGSFGGGVYVGNDYCNEKHVKLEQAIEDTRKASAEATANEIAKIEIKNTVVNNEVVERVRVERVYNDCKHTPASMKLIKEAFK
jgi:1,4-dihydroxy-2-naphthoyl-CoA synthase